MIDNYKNFKFVVFQIVILNIKNFNNGQKFLVLSIVLIFQKKNLQSAIERILGLVG